MQKLSAAAHPLSWRGGRRVDFLNYRHARATVHSALHIA
jgi:hypothetical protein